MTNTYTKILKLWKCESFRLHAAEMKRDYQIKEINENINHLNERKAQLQSEECKPFSFEQGNNKSKIKELLSCDDHYAKKILSTYPVPEKKRSSISKMIYKFVEALVSS